MDCHPIQTNWCPHLWHPDHFLCRMPFLAQLSQFFLMWDRHQICWLAYPATQTHTCNHFNGHFSGSPLTHTQPFYGSVEFVRDNPGEPVPEETFTHSTHRGHQSSLSAFSIYYDPYSIHVLYSLFQQSLSKFSLVYLLAPSSSYSIHFFTQSLSSFCNTRPYHHSPFCCSTEIMSSNPSLSLNPLLGILSCSFMPHIHLTILISACCDIWRIQTTNCFKFQKEKNCSCFC